MGFDVETFWDTYTEGGIVAALIYARQFTGTEDANDVIKEHVPALITEAKERNIEIIKFLSELDQLEQVEMAEKEDDTTGTGDDGGELRDDSSSPADSPEDQVGPEPDGSDDTGPDSETDD
jgi:hypothetical protein